MSIRSQAESTSLHQMSESAFREGIHLQRSWSLATQKVHEPLLGDGMGQKGIARRDKKRSWERMIITLPELTVLEELTVLASLREETVSLLSQWCFSMQSSQQLCKVRAATWP